MVDDPRLVRLRSALAGRPTRQLARAVGDRDAAVALVLRPRDDLELLLIQRSVHESDPWSGHIALPGGRRDADDADLFHTACRETFEETDLPLGAVGHLLGPLDEIAPGTPLLPPIVISPFVTAVPASADARAASVEVATTLWVPLSALRDERAASELLIELTEGSRAFPSLVYQGHTIWGLTHRIVKQLLEVAARAGI